MFECPGAALKGVVLGCRMDWSSALWPQAPAFGLQELVLRGLSKAPQWTAPGVDGTRVAVNAGNIPSLIILVGAREECTRCGGISYDLDSDDALQRTGRLGGAAGHSDLATCHLQAQMSICPPALGNWMSAS